MQERERKGVVSMWSAGVAVFEIAKRPRSQDSVPHTEQWSTVTSVSESRRVPVPLGHLQSAPEVEHRSLEKYDQYCGTLAAKEVSA